MRILLLSPWVPWPPHDGVRLRILNTLRHLSRRHHVTLVAPIRRPRDVVAVQELRSFCERIVTAEMPNRTTAVVRRAVRGMLRGRPLFESIHYGHAVAEQVRALAAARPYDVVQVELSWFGGYLQAIPEGRRPPTVLSMHNIESLRFARELGSGTSAGRRLVLTWDRLFAGAWEQRLVRAVDGVTVVSETERQWVERVAPDTRVAVAPNGVDTEHFRPLSAPSGRALVFTGAMDYPPNVDGVLWFHREIWPRLRRAVPGLRLQVVGRSPGPRIRSLSGRDGIEVTGEVADVRPYLGHATAVVVPLRAGAGTRLKILEAMAMARPVISTTLGAEGLDVTGGSDILLADPPADFARAVESVLRSPDTARRMGDAGRRLAVARYDWRRCLEAFDLLYERLLDRKGVPATTVIEP